MQVHSRFLKEKNFKKGARPGHKGYGRKIPMNIECEEVIHEVSEEDSVCSCCGESYVDMGVTEESIEIQVRIIVTKIIHVRRRKVRKCNCEDAPKTVTALKPVNVIPKGMYTHKVLAMLLYFKYGLQIPLTRALQLFDAYGLSVNRGTITGIFAKLEPILFPLYEAFIDELEPEEVLYVDETGLRHFYSVDGMQLSDAERPEKLSWLWVFCGETVTVFVADKSRSSAVLTETLGTGCRVILVSDGAPCYRKFAREEDGVLHARCWSHLRRHFLDAAIKFPELTAWARGWREKIAYVFNLNERRLKTVPDTMEREAAQSV